jgi:hypothetical protein
VSDADIDEAEEVPAVLHLQSAQDDPAKNSSAQDRANLKIKIMMNTV